MTVPIVNLIISLIIQQASQVSQNSFSTGQNDGPVASLLRAKNQEIGELHQELQAKRHQEHQHKQKVGSLER